MRAKNVFIIASIVSCIGFSCKKPGIVLVDPSVPLPGNPSVFPAGSGVYVTGTDNGYPVCWKDGTEYPLATAKGSAGAILIQGNDVYITGSLTINGVQTAVYWKNGAMVTLGAGGATGIAIAGTDVYVCGTRSNSNGSQAMYWKNGTQMALDLTTPFNSAYSGFPALLFTSSIAVQGTDIYVTGNAIINNDDILTGIIWKNGNATLLTPYSAATPNTNQQSRAGSVLLQGTDVYIGGAIDLGLNGAPVPPNGLDGAIYWKNGTPVQLAAGTLGSSIVSMVFQGADMYACGTKRDNSIPSNPNVAVYWKNTTPVTLKPDPGITAPAGYTLGTIPGGIALSGSDVYDAGYFYFFSGPAPTPHAVAAYWKNGQPLALQTTGASYAYGIAVIP